MATKEERPRQLRVLFHRLLHRASQPVSDRGPDPSKSETSESNLHDGCTGTCRSPSNSQGASG